MSLMEWRKLTNLFCEFFQVAGLFSLSLSPSSRCPRLYTCQNLSVPNDGATEGFMLSSNKIARWLQPSDLTASPQVESLSDCLQSRYLPERQPGIPDVP